MKPNSALKIGLGLLMTVILLMGGCAGTGGGLKDSITGGKSAAGQNPKISLNTMEVVHYYGWWYFNAKVPPTRGTAGEYGAPLDLAFVFDIENPNPYPVKLESIKFTVAFEEFDLNTVGSTEVQWIPPGKTNQVRVHAMFDGRQSFLSLMATGGFQLKTKGIDAYGQLEKWWTGIPEFSFPIHVKEGSAVFDADGKVLVSDFSAKFPG